MASPSSFGFRYVFASGFDAASSRTQMWWRSVRYQVRTTMFFFAHFLVYWVLELTTCLIQSSAKTIFELGCIASDSTVEDFDELVGTCGRPADEVNKWLSALVELVFNARGTVMLMVWWPFYRDCLCESFSCIRCR